MKEENDFFKTPLFLTNQFTLPSRVILAPMEGIMNRGTFFQAASEMHLIDSWMPPFTGVSKGAAPKTATLRKNYGHFLASRLPFTLQVLGNDPETLVKACHSAFKLGINSVNLNCGCPSKTVLSSGSGGALLKSPDRICEILQIIRKELPELCLSIKLRTGYKDAAEFSELAHAIREGNPHWVILHYRTVQEGYRDVPLSVRLKRFQTARVFLENIPFFANGDILTPEDAGFYHENCGCDGVAVARGMMHDPFLLRKIKGEIPVQDMRAEFLHQLSLGLRTKQQKKYYIECVKMVYGETSEEFHQLLEKNTDPFFSKPILRNKILYSG